MFPGARFVLNTRDLEQVAQSKWWAGRETPCRAADRWSEIVEALAPLGDAAYRVHYDDYVADPTVLRGLFDWLGPFDEAGCATSWTSATPTRRRERGADRQAVGPSPS